MSTDYFFVSGGECIHVAQDGMSGFTFYYGERECMRQLRNFLDRHKGNPIQFVSEHRLDECDPTGDQIKEVAWVSNLGREPDQ